MSAFKGQVGFYLNFYIGVFQFSGRNVIVCQRKSEIGRSDIVKKARICEGNMGTKKIEFSQIGVCPEKNLRMLFLADWYTHTGKISSHVIVETCRFHVSYKLFLMNNAIALHSHIRKFGEPPNILKKKLKIAPSMSDCFQNTFSVLEIIQCIQFSFLLFSLKEFN